MYLISILMHPSTTGDMIPYMCLTFRYHYDYSVNMDGKLTIAVVLGVGGVQGQYYNNTNWTPPINLTQYTNNLSFSWGGGDVVGCSINT